MHVGCGNGKLTAAFRASDKYLVHGLDRDTAKVSEARKHIEACGLYGTVSVDSFDDKQGHSDKVCLNE